MEETEIIAALEVMEADPNMVTESAYRANTEKWPDNRITFIENHVTYLRLHPNVNPRYYLANLRLMLRKNSEIRRS
jgi:hypothetical protein